MTLAVKKKDYRPTLDHFNFKNINSDVNLRQVINRRSCSMTNSLPNKQFAFVVYSEHFVTDRSRKLGLKVNYHVFLGSKLQFN